MREVGHFITGIRPLPLESVQIVKSITLGMRTDSKSHYIWKVYTDSEIHYIWKVYTDSEIHYIRKVYR